MTYTMAVGGPHRGTEESYTVVADVNRGIERHAEEPWPGDLAARTTRNRVDRRTPTLPPLRGATQKGACSMNDEDESGPEPTGIICRVWPTGCAHPHLCQDACFDDDLVREREYQEEKP
jgi:hypothetical protein